MDGDSAEAARGAGAWGPTTSPGRELRHDGPASTFPGPRSGRVSGRPGAGVGWEEPCSDWLVVVEWVLKVGVLVPMFVPVLLRDGVLTAGAA